MKKTIKTELSKFSSIEIFKEGNEIFTLFLTGKNLDNFLVYNKINNLIVDLQKTYPLVEVMKNEDTYFLLILKKDNNV